jgi:hypothetical protein
VLVKILNLFHFIGKSTDIFGGKNRFQADILYLTHAFAANASTV